MNTGNHFRFESSTDLQGVKVLTANMHDFSYDKHAHEEYSLGVTVQGRQDFFCCRRFHKSPPGGVMLFNPDDVHDGHSGGTTDLSYVMTYIHPRALHAPFLALGVKPDHTLRIEGVLFDDLVMKQQILMLTRMINSGYHSKIEQELSLFRLAHTLVKKSGALHEATPQRRQDTLLTRAKEFINSQYQNNLSIDDIAAVASMSKYHFIRLFRAQFGITPHQYVVNCRINGAQKALESGLPATAVAQMFCFADVSHMNRRFKKLYGMTPKQYQNQLTLTADTQR
ncbi:AraC family transcriptional regulator [Vibrio mangrovi]|uniref:AraC family transcriptional regulator n=1 Tax=Vibrio mangrovi TaxID=474394 RepID=A0A1Y6ISC6_9VIBR|nr:AraC family transcriptional regulator [Vibrio mangrovi]MDW6001424.1 AraC family transcriptional regulator [Vibrio mangrovi]SMS00554.1 Arabinose operon regulatory protein [Vibrio mangrovi]